MPAKVLFFDVGNTLLFPNRGKILRVLHDRQVFPSDDLLGQVERDARREFDAMAERNSHVDRGFWNIYYGKLLQALGVSEDSICRDLIAYTRVSANWCDIRPGTRAVLERLRQNFRLGVISNSDGKIAEVLSRCGIADVFESITDSGNVGKEKPHPEIFNSALRSLGVSPEASTYIGDVYCVDYVGATRCGMSAILFDVAGAYKESALPRVESLEELASRLLDSSEMPIR